MTTPTTSLSYRKAALQHASPVGLVIALYDTLLGNLDRAAAALDRKDIQGRCAELVHGFKVLQQLELMVDTEKGGQAAANLRRLYNHIRKQMLAAQFKLSSAMLREQMKILLEVRQAWAQVDARGNQQMQASHVYPGMPSQPAGSMSYPQGAEQEMDHSSFSCSV